MTTDSSSALSPLRPSDYEAIEAAVMETEKGRWFLAEYARRNRVAETETVLSAIGNLEKLMKRERRPDADRIRLDIAEMKDAIEKTKLEIAQLKQDGEVGSRFDRASNELDAIVEHTEIATSEILGSAEKIQEIAWTLREAGVEEEICGALENLTMTIYTACSFQDLTGQRTQKVVRVLRYLEGRIDSMIDIWGMENDEVAQKSASGEQGPILDNRPDAHLLNGPALRGEGVEQNYVDELMMDFSPLPREVPLTEAGLQAAEDEYDVAFLEVSPREAAPVMDYAEGDLLEDDVLEDEALVEASAGEDLSAHIDDAVSKLKSVSAEMARMDLPEGVDDPFEVMTKIERQALFS